MKGGAAAWRPFPRPLVSNPHRLGYLLVLAHSPLPSIMASAAAFNTKCAVVVKTCLCGITTVFQGFLGSLSSSVPAWCSRREAHGSSSGLFDGSG